MPLRTQRYDLTNEIERIDAELEDLRETQERLEDSDEETDDALRVVSQQITTLEAQKRGARWARDEAHLPPSEGGVEAWGHSVDSVELAGLTAGEIAQVSTEVTNPHPRVQEIHMVAQGTEDAPYHDASASYGDRVETVGNLPAAFIKWAYGRIDDLSTVGNSKRTASKPTSKETRSQTPTSN